MVDHLSRAGRSRVMAAIRSKDTKPELALRAALRASGATGYRIHRRDLPGNPDIVFMRWKVAVFVDGVYWHGHPDHFHPDRTTDYWRNKIARTQERDRIANSSLRHANWRVIRAWDLDVKADPEAVASLVTTALREKDWPGQPKGKETRADASQRHARG